MKKYILSCCIFMACLSLQAQQKWSLRQCIDYAIENNIEIKQQALQVKSSEIDLNTSKNSRLPDLNGSLSYNFNFGQSIDPATNSSVSMNMSGGRVSVSSSVPLFTGFKIPNQIKVDEFNLMASAEGLSKAKENLELQVTSLYLDVLFKKELLKTYKEQAQLTKTQVERTEMLEQAGKVPRSQVFDIRAQLAKDELNIVTALNDFDLSVLNLSQALNLETMSGFEVVEPDMENVVADNQSSILPPSEIYQGAIAIKPHVKEAQYNLESSKKALKVAQADYYPTVSFSMGYGTSVQRLYNAHNPSFRDQVKNYGSEYLGFTVNIPIFNRFRVRNQVRSARLNIENRELALDNVKLALFKEIQQAYQSAVSSRSKFASTEKAYTAAEESYRYAEERYQVGKSTVFELNEAQTKLLTSKSEQIQAKYDFLFRAKILDFYNGKEINIE